MKDNTLSISDLIRSGELYDKIYSFRHDIPFYKKWASKVGGPILEMCCGTGRITLPIAEIGMEIIGVDFMDSMLNRANSKIPSGLSNVVFQKADVRKFNLKRTFKLILIPFNSLEDFYHLEEIENVLKCIRIHSNQETVVIFDVNNPNASDLAQGKRSVPITHDFEIQGSSVHIDEEMYYDSARLCNRVTRTYTIDGEKKKASLDLRVYFPQELQVLLKNNGFDTVHRYGDFNESPFSALSPKQICVCKLK
jgi:ubiquinone/menaquinone biosynthesis C-methylase UbiE